MAATVRAGQTSLNISSYYLTFSKAKHQFRADEIIMLHLLQSPNVVSNLSKFIQINSVMDKRRNFNTEKAPRMNMAFPQAVIANDLIFLSGMPGLDLISGQVV